MPTSPRFVLVTGLSGAGKSQALRFFEDFGLFCVDNLPAPLIPTIAELRLESESSPDKIAVCVDARSGEDLEKLPGYLDMIAEMGFRPMTLFLESSDEVLHRRYSESRRRHPASPTGSIEEGIQRERRLLAAIKERADLVVDTSTTSTADLRERISTMFADRESDNAMTISVMSFGFKYGVPQEADLVFDMRFLPNPYYEDDLRQLTGSDPEVREFVVNTQGAQEFLTSLSNMLKALLPRYAAEPKSYLTVALGCTGGRHRSVAMAREVHRLLRDLQYEARLRDRDIDRDTNR